MESGRNQEETRDGAAAFLLRLLQKMRRPAHDDGDAGDSLQPPGRRSGEGTESLAPYLHHGRNTRPGPLE